MSTLGAFTADPKGRPRSAAEIVTASGTRIYLMPVETFPGHVNNVYLIDHPDHPVLFDVGTLSGHDELQSRFREVQDRFGVKTGLTDVREAVVSHAHVDHFGNAGTIRDLGISIAIHELDARVLAGFTERLALASRDIGIFLRHAGLAPDAARDLVDLYRTSKHFFHDLAPDRRLKNGDTIGPGFRVLHVPGHCPGMICLAVDDVVLTADHLLSRITPIQSPQAITPYMGLENYLRSLEKLRDFGYFTLGLGAHEAPIRDVRGRIDASIAHHAERLRKVHGLCEERGLTIADVAQALFGTTKSYAVLLALLEAGAHVEYLHELGHLTIENVHDVADDPNVAARYRATTDAPAPVRRA
ncbi:MAG: MBL fold metallo-hydrolase [Acidobacteriota bacterium]